ncbi:Uncharacterized protein QTN25_004193 [Entamoeba marina]
MIFFCFFFLLIFSSSAKFLNVHLFSSTVDLTDIMETIKSEHPTFYPLDYDTNVIHIDLYSTLFLDDLEQNILLVAAKALTLTSQCNIRTSLINSYNGKVYIELQPSSCLSSLSNQLVSELSFYRDPYHKNNLCANETATYCDEYGEPDVFNNYIPQIHIGYDQEYYEIELDKELNGFEVVRISDSNEERIVSPTSTITNIYLRKAWDLIDE